MRLFWVRHGEMDFRAHTLEDFSTINRLFNQETEGELSEKGRQEARSVALHFEKNPVQALYASPLIRAKQTGEATAELIGAPLEVIGEITELRTGHLPTDSTAARILEGVTNTPYLPQGAKKFVLGATLIPLYFQSWRSGRTVGGESHADLQARLDRLFAMLRERHDPGHRVALFAHGYLIFYLSAVLARPPLARLPVLGKPYIPNGSITEMELGPSGPPRLVRYAQTQHL